MKYPLKIFFLLLTILFFNNSYADDATQQLTQLLDRIQTMQANFTETVLNKHGQAISESTGKMALERPGKFRWDVKQPNAQLIVTNGKKLWIYDRDLEQVSIRSLEKEPGEAPALLLSRSDTSLINKFHIKISQDGQGMQWFTLVPKDSSDMFTSIKLGFLKQHLQQMQLNDHLGNKTNIAFSNITTDVNLSANTFSFTPPRNVDVLDETKH